MKQLGRKTQYTTHDMLIDYETTESGECVASVTRFAGTSRQSILVATAQPTKTEANRAINELFEAVG